MTNDERRATNAIAGGRVLGDLGSLFFRSRSLLSRFRRGASEISIRQKISARADLARAFVADRSSIAICTTTQHSTHSNTTRPHASQKKKSFLTRPRFLYQDIGVDPKERLPSRVVVPVGASDAAKRRVASRPFFRPRRALNPAGIDACRYLRVDLGPTRTVARRSASASPPRRPRAAGPRARRGASPRDRPTSRGAPEGRSARP